MILTGKPLGCQCAKRRATAIATKRIVVVRRLRRAVLPNDHTGRTQLIPQVVGNAIIAGIPRAPHRATLVVFGGRTTLVFIQPRCIRGGGAADCAKHPIAIGIIGERRQRRHTLLYAGQSTFVVEVEGVGRATDGARGLVANCIVTIRVTKRRRHRMRLAATISVCVAVVAADITDEVISIRMGVAACAGGTEGCAAGIPTKGAGQPVGTCACPSVDARHTQGGWMVDHLSD